MKRISKIQKQNKVKLTEMSEKIVNAMKRLEEIRKRLANARLKQLNEQVKKEKSAPKKNDTPKTLFISKGEIILNKINRHSLKEFTNFAEFLKFNKKDSITKEELDSFDPISTINQILE